ncbi:MAG TPA: ABC transporter permease, partial [Longimicrobiales bacterium]|nr:ABC transporter permease [Longimicrobiales bacterium]
MRGPVEGKPGGRPDGHGMRLPAVAAFLTRTGLLLYPPSFRKETRTSMLADIRARAMSVAASATRIGALLWILRLGVSLLGNAPAAWFEAFFPNRRSARARRKRWAELGGRRPSPFGHGGPGGRTSAFSWLDLKLGLRMLLKYPGLTAGGVLGIAVAIGVSAGFFAFSYGFFYPDIPLDEGDRLVGLENWDLEINNEERRSLHDFVLWREEMRSVEDMSAFRTVSRNLVTGDGPAELVRIAEMTPSGFDLARVPPLLGRTLVEADAAPEAPDVLVLGYDPWRTRFAADPEIVGKEVRIGREVHTVVGVMPEGFAFPMNHGFWVPLREDPAEYALGEGPSIFISGRLAPGFDLDDAQAELTVIGRRMAAEHPDTHGRFRAQVMPYVYPLVDVNQQGGETFFWQIAAMNSFISLLLVLVGLNVAVLIYARTATRRGEIAVRTALGASRGRIVGQLFAESLVLAVAGAAVGLLLARVGMGLGDRILATEVAEIPFWMDLGVPGPAVAYTIVLTVLAAVITGVLPGLQATSKRVQRNLRQYHGGAGLRLGRTWTALIVVQVAVAVAGLPLAVAAGWGEVATATTRPAYDVDRMLTVALVSDEEGLPADEAEAYRRERAEHLAGVRSEVLRRLESEPGVVSYTAVRDIPGLGGGVRVTFEDAGSGSGPADGYRARSTRVHPDFFGVFEVPILAGRPLLPSDLEEGAPDVVVVDRTFARRLLGGQEALGRRLRMVIPGPDRAEAVARWYEIVGIAEN